jgi:hypothetical protein
VVVIDGERERRALVDRRFLLAADGTDTALRFEPPLVLVYADPVFPA